MGGPGSRGGKSRIERWVGAGVDFKAEQRRNEYQARKAQKLFDSLTKKKGRKRSRKEKQGGCCGPTVVIGLLLLGGLATVLLT